MCEENALEINNLCKDYKDFQLKNVSFSIPQGKIMGLIGENGAGKSTTIKLVLNLMRRSSGEIRIYGKDCVEFTPNDKEDLGVVLDDVGIPACLNARQVGNVMNGSFSRWNARMYDDILKRLSVPDRVPFKSFSRGMRMKLGFAVALAHEPRFLLLDEATSGLDPLVREDVLDMLLEFASDGKRSVLLSSHIISDLEKVCDSIAFLHKGELLLCEDRKKLYEDYRVVRVENEKSYILDRIDKSAFIGCKAYRQETQAIVRADMLPEGYPSEPADIEKLFVFMAGNEERRAAG